MSPEGRRFRPGLALTLAAVLSILLLCSLGLWQLQRLEEKTELLARMRTGLRAAPVELEAAPADPEALLWRRVRVRGELLPSGSFALGIVAQDGRSGARLVTPLRLADGSLLLVSRGWIPASRIPELGSRTETPRRVLFEGVLRGLRAFRRGWFTPEDDAEARHRYALDAGDLARWLGEAPLPLLLEAERAEPPEVLAVPLGAPRLPRNPHLGYAVTWFSLAAALAVIYLLLGLQRGRR